MKKEFNLKHFRFEVDNFKTSVESWKSFYELKNKKTLEEHEKEWLKLAREELRQKSFQITGIHTKSGIKKTWEAITDKFDRKSFAKELAAEVKKVRTDWRKTKTQSKMFAGASYQLEGGVFTKDNQINKIGQQTTYNDPMSEKKPTSKTKNYIGVELEFNDNTDHRAKDIANALRDAKLGRYVNVTTDGSCGWEVRVILTEDNWIDPLTKILSVLNKMGFSTNSECGTHVHLDMRNRKVEDVYSNFFFSQNFMRKFLTKSRKHNTYCKKNTKDTFVAQSSNGDRYYGINPQSYQRHQTLEIRMHQGTLDESKLVPWIKMLLKIANYTGKVSKRISTLKQATLEYSMEPDLKSLLEKRIMSESGRKNLVKAMQG